MFGDFLAISSLPSFSPYFPLLDRRVSGKTSSLSPISLPWGEKFHVYCSPPFFYVCGTYLYSEVDLQKNLFWEGERAGKMAPQSLQHFLFPPTFQMAPTFFFPSLLFFLLWAPSRDLWREKWPNFFGLKSNKKKFSPSTVRSWGESLKEEEEVEEEASFKF